jgi:hypothetical protein
MTRYLEAEAAIPAVSKTPLNRQQIVGFWAAWTGWMLDGMDSVIYALVLGPALAELLPRSGLEAISLISILSAPSCSRCS